MRSQSMSPNRVSDHYFYGKRPPYTYKQIFIKLILRLVFPPIIVWDALKFSINYFFGKLISQIFLPSQQMFNKHQPLQAKANIQLTLIKNNNALLKVIKPVILTYDHACLDTIEMQIKASNNTTTLPYIINFCDRDQCYEKMISDMEQQAMTLNCHVIGFNYRNVGNSTGKLKCIDQLIVDGITQVNRLLLANVDPKRIILKGQGTGGGIATMVAKYFFDHGININLFNDRCPSSMTNMIVGRIRTYRQDHTRTGHQEPNKNIILSWFLKPMIMALLVLTKWEINIASSYKALPDACKEYMLIRSSKRNRAFYGRALKDDTTITHYASLHLALKSQRHKQLKPIKQALAKTIKASGCALVKDDITLAQQNLQNAKEHYNERKMVSMNLYLNAHNQSYFQLFDRHQSQNANRFFQNFVHRTQRSPREEESLRILIDNLRL